MPFPVVATEADPLIKELEKTDFVGVNGKTVFDETHDVKDGPGFVNTLFVQWQEGGKRVVVWPKDMAGGNMVSPPWLASN